MPYTPDKPMPIGTKVKYLKDPNKEYVLSVPLFKNIPVFNMFIKDENGVIKSVMPEEVSFEVDLSGYKPFKQIFGSDDGRGSAQYGDDWRSSIWIHVNIVRYKDKTYENVVSFQPKSSGYGYAGMSFSMPQTILVKFEGNTITDIRDGDGVKIASGGSKRQSKTDTYKKTAKKYTDSKGTKYVVYKKGEKQYIKKLSKATGKFTYRAVQV